MSCAAIRAAHRRVEKSCQGEVRRVIEVDGEGNELSVTWLFYVPPGVSPDQGAETVELPLMIVRGSAAPGVSTPEEDRPEANGPRQSAGRSGGLGALVEAMRRHHLGRAARPPLGGFRDA